MNEAEQAVVELIADDARLAENGDGTYTLTHPDGETYLVEIKVHDVTGA